MTVKQAQELDMVEYLSRLGFEPTEIKSNNYWYLSPLRSEKTPSFKVNRKMNRWYDWGEGKGGNLVDFGVAFYKCDVTGFLQKLAASTHFITSIPRVDDNHQKENEKPQIRILSVKPITSIPLLRYLRKRRISEVIANKYCKEVTYELKDKNYFAIGFKNDSGGYELRNEYIKAASSPKDATFINNGAKDLAAFEGCFNFLSYLTIHHKLEQPLRNFLILNSTSFFQKKLPLMQEHNRVHLYLDNDKTGEKFTTQAIELNNAKFIDERGFYKNYSDLNDMLVNLGQSQKQGLNHKL
jgi:hypothetical protein